MHRSEVDVSPVLVLEDGTDNRPNAPIIKGSFFDVCHAPQIIDTDISSFVHSDMLETRVELVAQCLRID